MRKSFREVLCKQCGKSMGKVYFANVPKKYDGLTPEEVVSFWSFMKVDVNTHEKECPAQKKEDKPAGS